MCYLAVWFAWSLGGQSWEVRKLWCAQFFIMFAEFIEQGDDNAKGCGFDPCMDHSLKSWTRYLWVPSQNTLWLPKFNSSSKHQWSKQMAPWREEPSNFLFKVALDVAPAAILVQGTSCGLGRGAQGVGAQWTPAQLLPHPVWTVLPQMVAKLQGKVFASQCFYSLCLCISVPCGWW